MLPTCEPTQFSSSPEEKTSPNQGPRAKGRSLHQSLSPLLSFLWLPHKWQTEIGSLVPLGLSPGLVDGRLLSALPCYSFWAGLCPHHLFP